MRRQQITITHEEINALAMQFAQSFDEEDDDAQFMSVEDWTLAAVNWLRRSISELLFNPLHYGSGRRVMPQEFQLRPECIKPFCHEHVYDGQVTCHLHRNAAQDPSVDPPKPAKFAAF
jgi:hypothetical protein